MKISEDVKDYPGNRGELRNGSVLLTCIEGFLSEIPNLPQVLLGAQNRRTKIGSFGSFIGAQRWSTKVAVQLGEGLGIG